MKDESFLFVLAGEHSGDLHGATLLQALKQHRPQLRVVGVGGPEMQAQGMQSLLPMDQFQVFGFTDIALKLPQLIRQFRHIRDYILTKRPQAVLLIDYPGFNLRLAKSLRKHGYQGKIIQYVSPTVWVWGKKRIDTLAQNFDLLLTLFPFEPALFAHTDLPVKFVGHPLLEHMHRHTYDPSWYTHLGLKRPERSLALFPGSRPGEIQRLFPRQLAAAVALQREDPRLMILISCADPHLQHSLEREIQLMGLLPGNGIHLIPRQYRYDLMRDCHLALAKSGTVTLELALHAKPTVVVYEVSRINYFIAKYLLRLGLSHYCIVNILGGKTIFPEFIEQAFSTENLVTQLRQLDEEGPKRASCLAGCLQVKQALQTPEGSFASENAAKEIESLIPC